MSKRMSKKKKNTLIIEFDGKPVSLNGDTFRCCYFELTNRCDSISQGIIRFSGSQSGEGDVSLLSNGHSFIGSKAVIKYEYAISGISHILFAGYVSGVTSYNNGGITSVEFILSSPEFWLLSGRNVPIWDKSKTYSDILNEIFSRYDPKLGTYNIEFSESIPGCLTLTHGDENDYDYVKRIAHQTGSMFFSLDGCVIFKPIEPGPLSYNIKFSGQTIKVTSNLVGIPKGVSMTYIKDDDYENPITVNETLPDQIGIGLLPDSISSNVDSSTSLKFVDLDIDSDQTAKFLAQRKCKRKSLNFITCELSGDFMPHVKVGSNIMLSNFNSTVDNNYILTSITHKFKNSKEGGASLSSTVILNSDSLPSASSFRKLNSFLLF